MYSYSIHACQKHGQTALITSSLIQNTKHLKLMKHPASLLAKQFSLPHYHHYLPSFLNDMWQFNSIWHGLIFIISHHIWQDSFSSWSHRHHFSLIWHAAVKNIHICWQCLTLQSHSTRFDLDDHCLPLHLTRQLFLQVLVTLIITI